MTKMPITGPATPNQGSTSHQNKREPYSRRSTYSRRLEALDTQPRRHPLIHTAALALSLVSLGILIAGVASFKGPVTLPWIILDVVLGVFFALEFFTRSGFRWNPVTYASTHVFDFIAIVPALIFLNHGVPAEGVWVWLVLVARFVRAVDRILGDGFIGHNLIALVEGFEEELTDRVSLRIMDRIQIDLVEGKFGHSAADALVKNKDAVLRRVRGEHPHNGLGAELAHLTGLEAAIERAEERIYDAMIEVLKSSEVDDVIRANLDTIFEGLREDIGQKEWRKHLGFGHKHPPVSEKQKPEV